MENNMQFKDVFKQARRIAMLDQADIAEKVGVTVQCVRKWEKGETRPTQKHMKQLVWVLSDIPEIYITKLMEVYACK